MDTSNSYRDSLSIIKDELIKIESVCGIFVYGSIAKGDFSFASQIEIIVLVVSKENIDNVIKLIDSISKLIKYSIKSDVIAVEDIEKSENKLFDYVLKEGKLIYWNSLHDFSASQIIKIKPHTIFVFDLSKLEQNNKVRFNYQFYGKKSSKGMLDQLEGKRLSRSCFYVPFSKKYKVIRFFDKFDITYETFESWM